MARGVDVFLRTSDLLGLGQWVCSRSAANVLSPTKDLSIGLQLAYETTPLVLNQKRRRRWPTARATPVQNPSPPHEQFTYKTNASAYKLLKYKNMRESIKIKRHPR
jgi:hypothetical protein